MYQAKDFQIEMLETGKVEECYVSHVTDPENFYIQLSTSTDTLEQMATALANQSPSGEEHVWHLGDPCGAVFDQQWSRGRVTGTPHRQEHLEVTFVDYGNKDYLLKKDVCPLSPEMLTIPVLSHHCCLEGVSCSESFWAPENIAKFEDLVMDKELTAHIVSYDELQDVYHLLLFDENQASINEEFARLSGSLCDGNKASPSLPSPEGTAANRAPGVRYSSQSSLPPLKMDVGDRVNISIVHLPSPSEWWCNQTSYSEALKSLTKQMGQTYGSMGPGDCVLDNMQPGTLCAVLNQAENRWERALIEKVVGTSVTVTAVDLGLKDTVPAGRVRELREEFRKLPAQAVLCCLHGLVSECGAWTENACNLFRDLVGAKFFTATVMEKDGDGRLHMNLMDCVTNSNVATTFLGKCGEASRGTPPPLHPSVQKEVPRHPAVSVKTPSKSKVLLSWINTPGDFYIQLGENMTQIEKITQTLETACNSPQAQPASDVSVGALVAARFSEDQEWYRAVVKSTAKQSSVVEFVDFGNVDSVATDSLQELGPELCSLPAQALRCSLARVRPLNQGSTWSGDAREFLDKLTAKGALCHFLSRQGDRYEVDLEVEGKDIAREMIALAVVRGSTPEAASAGSPRVQRYQFVEPRMGQTYRGYVAFIQSVESFYVQLADRMEDLEKLMEDLQAFYEEAGKGRPVSSFVTGLPCAAKYEDDEQWYRAKIRSFTLRDADIFFVDYGNTQSSPKGSVFQLDPAFVSRMEALALHCQLGVAESRSPEAQVDQFNDFTENEELEVVIKGKEGSKLLVDLMKNGVSLTQELRSGQSTKAAPVEKVTQELRSGQSTKAAPVEKVVSGYTPGKVSPGQTVSAFVSYIESPARFWVQLAGCDDELTSLMRSLRSHYNSGAEDPLSNPTPGQPCVAMYEEDKEWYRASVMSVHGTEIKVQFVDYGNTDLVDRQKVRPISAGFMSSPLLAVECCLEGFQSCSMADDAVCLMESLMSEQELSVTFRGPKTVTVKAANIEIAQALRNNGLGTPQRSPMSQTSPLQPSPRGKNPPVGGSPFSADSRSSSGSPNSGGPFLVFKEAVPPSGSAEAIMTHVDKKSGMIYVQLLSSESQLQQLSSRLQSLFSPGGSPLQQGSLTKGLACCAQFSQDQCWYRAIVQQVRGPNAGVLFVDYGNDDTVPISNLKSIPPDLMESPKHAFECKLKGLKSWTPQAYKALCRCMDEQLNVRFVTSSSPFEIQASVNGQDLLQLMFKSPAASPSQSSTDSRSDTRDSRNSRQTSHPPSRQNGFAGTGQSYKKPEQQSFGSPRDQKQTWDKGLKPRYNAQSASPNSPAKETVVEQVFEAQTVPVGEQAACVSTISEDGTFFVQLVRDLTVIDELTAKIEKCPSVPHPCPCVGAACGARYSEDGRWYRGLVKAVAGSSAHVVFVDFGNEETCPLDSLKPLPAHLLTPPLAYLCQAGGVKLTAEQQEAFTAASAEKEYSVTFRGSAPYDVIVKEENGTNLMETIFRPTAIPPPQAPSQTVHAIVSHVGQDGHFYLQLYSQLDAIANFREEIQTACGEHTEKMDSVAEGQFCFAKFSEDEAWYRAAVLKVSGDEVTVLFVDYGNEDTLDKSQLLAMSPAFMARPAWAFNCKIPKVKKWSEGQKRKFEAMTDGKLMNAHFLTSAPPYEVELTLDIGLELEEDEDEVGEEKPAEEPSENVEVEQPEETPEDSGDAFEDAQEEPAAELEENAEELPGMAQECTKDNAELESGEDGAKLESGEAPGPDLQDSPESAPPVRGPDSDKAAAVLEYPSQTPPALDACIVSHLNEDGTFYLQLLSDDESREKLSEKLQEECESSDSKTVVRPAVNLPCSAKFSDDEAWYRAIIEKVDDEMVTVLFVDFGNKDDVSVGDLRELATESLQVPPLAYKCILEDCDTQLVSSKLEEATADQTLTVTFSTTEIIPYSVNLQLEDGINISTVLLKPAEELSSSLVLQEVSEPAEHRVDDGGCAADRKAVALVQGQRVKVTVSDAASPSLFHVQIDENLPALEEMSDAMFEHYSSLAEEDGTVDSVAEGQLCACQFGEDGLWYRAVVQSMDAEADSCRLFYVDYGNSDTVPKSSVRELPAEFQALAWQCVSCSLAGVCCPQEWSEEAKAAFEEMVSNKSVTADVLRGDGIATPYLVHVFHQGKSVADSLLGLNLPGVETAAIPATPSAAQASAAEPNSSSAAAEAAKPSYESLSEETVESGLVEKEDVEEKETLENLEESEQEFSQHLHKCSAQETIDDLDESEQEFSRQLQACTARMESTLVEEARSSRQKGNSTTWEEPSAIGSQEGQGKEEEEEEDDFEDAVEAEQNSAEEDGNVSEEAQVACGCVSDGLAELEWLDIHVCVAVSASEFWCQLPDARSILAGTTLGIERARASGSGGVREVRVGHLYLVCDPPHTNYRGKVLSEGEEGGGVVVLKLDYGTEERVAPACLHPLARHQLELPAQAFCCCLGDADEVGASQEWLDNLIAQGEAVDSDLQVKVVGRKANGVLLVDVQERPGSSKNSSSQAAEEEESEGDVQTSSNSSKPVGGEVSMDTLEISQPVLQSTILGDTMAQYHMEKSEGGENDYLSHSLDDFKDYRVTVAPGGEPDSFYVVKASSQGLLEALADEIEEDVKESVDSLPDGEALAVNSPCLVLEQSSATWFRGQVRSTGERLKVLCVDRGVVLEVGKEEVRELPTRLLDTPVQAVLCCLADVVPVEDQWCEAALTLFTDFISSSSSSGGPLKVTSQGLCPDSGAHRVTLRDESQSEGSVTRSIVGVECSINRSLVELGYAEAVPGSPLEVALQVERTINDPDTIDQMETSFTEQSLLRENSLGDESDVEENREEEEQDAIKASGDAPSVATESDEESKRTTPPADARMGDPSLAGRSGGTDGEEGSTLSDKTDNSSVVTVCTASGEESGREEREGSVLTTTPTSLSPATSWPERPGSDWEGGGVVRGEVGGGAESGEESEETVEEYVSADGLPDIGEVLAEGGVSGGKDNAQDLAASDTAATGSADHVVPAVESSSVHTCPASSIDDDDVCAVYIECSGDDPPQGSVVVDARPVFSNSPSTPTQGVGVRERSETDQSQDEEGPCFDLSGEGLDTEGDDRGHVVQCPEEDKSRYVTVEEVLKGVEVVEKGDGKRGSLDRPERTDTSTQPFEKDMSTQPFEKDMSTQPCEKDMTTQPCEKDMSTQPFEKDMSTQPCEKDMSTQPFEKDMSTQPCEKDMSTQPCEKDMSTQPCEKDMSTQSFEKDMSTQPFEKDMSTQPFEKDMSTQPCEGSGKRLVQPEASDAEELARERTVVDTMSYLLHVVASTAAVGEMKHSPKQTDLDMEKTGREQSMEKMDVGEKTMRTRSNLSETAAGFVLNVGVNTALEKPKVSAQKADQQTGKTDSGVMSTWTDTVRAAEEEAALRNVREQSKGNTVEAEVGEAEVGVQKTGEKGDTLDKAARQEGGLCEGSGGEEDPADEMADVFDPAPVPSDDAVNTEEATAPAVCDSVAEEGARVPPEEGARVPPEEGARVPPEEGARVPPEEGAKVPPEEGARVQPEAENCVDCGMEKAVSPQQPLPAVTPRLHTAATTGGEKEEPERDSGLHGFPEGEGVSASANAVKSATSSLESLISLQLLEKSGGLTDSGYGELKALGQEEAGAGEMSAEKGWVVCQETADRDVKMPLCQAVSGKPSGNTLVLKGKKKEEEEEFQDCVDFQLCKERQDRVGKGPKEQQLGQARKPDVEGWGEGWEKRHGQKNSDPSLNPFVTQYVEGGSYNIMGWQRAPSAQELTQHPLQDGGDQLAPAWGVSPMKCPLPSTSSEDSTLEGSGTQTDMAASPSKYTEKTAFDPTHPVASSDTLPPPQEDSQPDLTNAGLSNRSLPQSPLDPEGEVDSWSCSLSGGGSDSLEELAAQLEVMAVREMQQHQEEDNGQQQEELAQMIHDFGQTIDVEESPTPADGKGPELTHPEEKTGGVQQVGGSDPMVSSTRDRQAVCEVGGVAAVPERNVKFSAVNGGEGWLAVPHTEEEKPSAGDASASATTGVTPSLTTQRPEASVAMAEKTQAGDCAAETPHSHAAGPEVDHTTAETPGNQDILAETPGNQDVLAETPANQDIPAETPANQDIPAETPVNQDIPAETSEHTLEEKPQHMIEKRPQDSVEEKPQDMVEGRLQRMMGERPLDSREGRPRNTGGERPTDIVREKPPDSMEERPTDIVREKPQNSMEERPTDIVREKPQNSMEERPTDFVREKSQDSMEERPTDIVREKPQNSMEERPTDIVREKPQNSMEERPTDFVREKSQDSMEERPTDIVREKPQDSMEERPTDIVREKPQDSMEERPTDIVREKPQDSMEERPTDIVREKPLDTMGEKLQDTEGRQDTLEQKPQDTLEEKPQSTLEDRPQSTLEDRPQSTLEDRPQSTLEDRPQSTLEDRPQSTLEDRPHYAEEDRLQSTLEDRPQSTLVERPHDAMEDRPQSILEDRHQSILEDRPQSTLEEKTQSTLEDRPHGAEEDRPQSTLEDRPHNAEEDRPQSTLEDRPHDAVKKRLQNNDAVTDKCDDIVTDTPGDTVTDSPEKNGTVVTNTPEDMAAHSPEVPRATTVMGEDGDGAVMTHDYDDTDTLADLSGAGDTTAEISDNDVSLAELMAAEETEEMSGAGDTTAEISENDVSVAELMAAEETEEMLGSGEAMAEIPVFEAIPELMEAVLAELEADEAMAQIAKADDLTTTATDVGGGIAKTTRGPVSNFPNRGYALEERVGGLQVSQDGQKSGGVAGEEAQTTGRLSGAAVWFHE